MKNILTAIGAIIVLLVLCFCLGAVFGGKQTGTSTSTSAAPTATPPLPGLGDRVRVGTTTWVVDDARSTVVLRGEFNEARASGMFIVVEATITNGGDAAESLLTPDLADEAGKIYEATTDFEATVANDGQCTFERLNPGATQSCTFLYDVPNAPGGLEGWRLKATEMALFGAKQDILLVRAAK